jgi:hypothetical protein
VSIRVFDFMCPEGHVVEHFVDDKVREVPCDECGATAARLIAAPRAQLEGFSGDFPTAGDHWANMRESKMKAERRTMERHGEYADGSKVGDAFADRRTKITK